MTIMTFAQVAVMPEIGTSELRELQWQIDWYVKMHNEAKECEQIAWNAYNAAVNADEPNADEINALFEVATMFEGIRKTAFHAKEDAKAQYLKMLN
jgi:hypothetical protein